MEVKMCLSVPCWSPFSKMMDNWELGLKVGADRPVVTTDATPWQQRLPLTSTALASPSNLFIISS